MKNRCFIRILISVVIILSFQNVDGLPSIAGATDTLHIYNFVIKSYINLLSSKPSKKDLNQLCTKFSLFTSFDQKKGLLIDSLISDPGFYKNILDQYNYEYLQGTSKEQITENIRDYEFLCKSKDMSEVSDLFMATLIHLKELRDVQDDLSAGQISLSDAHKRFFNNKFYNDINMGPDNYVISTFNYLFYRNPTKYELEQGKKMINGQEGALFFKSGGSKDDYLDILFASVAYQEGQVRYWYSALLNREPSSAEILPYLDSQKPINIIRLIRNIILTDEYSGDDRNHLAGSHPEKDKMKSPGGLISISNSDINGTAIRISKALDLEASYNACGDKNVMGELILRSLMDETEKAKDAKRAALILENDKKFLDIISSCPHIGAYRALDPLLLCISTGMGYVDSLGLPLFPSGMAQYESWQARNTPHSPGGINEPNDANWTDEERFKWDVEYTANWVKSYPQEYRFTLNYYTIMYHNWHINPSYSAGSDKDFMMSKNDKLHVFTPTKIKVFFDPSYFGGADYQMTDEEYMRKNTREFIIQTYESLLFREPTAEEIKKLSEMIRKDEKISPKIFYYSLMSSSEYKYY